VGKKGPNKVICIPSQRAKPGLITSKGYTSKELEAGEVGKPSFFYRQFLRNKGTFLPRCKRCAQGGVGTD
ncbi:hypothetical protein L249_8436, partial [Ophiocordyceps polyrhachis-furcata BCC 54312]